MITDAIARNNHLPFASADSITVDKQALDQALRKLQLAQLQHRLIVDALLETFDVSEDVLRHDVERVVEVLARYGVLVPSVTEASR